jgi:hypothetical protein
MNTYPSPTTDRDTLTILDQSIRILADRRGLWLNTDAVFVHLIASLIDQAQNILPVMVRNARQNGATWNDIAQLLAMTPEEAQQQFPPTPRTNDN